MSGPPDSRPLAGVRVIDIRLLEPTLTFGSPWRLGSAPEGGGHSPAPLLGNATREVLREAGYEENEVAQLIEEGVAM